MPVNGTNQPFLLTFGLSHHFDGMVVERVSAEEFAMFTDPLMSTESVLIKAVVLLECVWAS